MYWANLRKLYKLLEHFNKEYGLSNESQIVVNYLYFMFERVTIFFNALPLFNIK